MVLTDSEEEEPEAQGRKSQDDPLEFSQYKDWLLLLSTQVNASSLDFQEEVDTGAEQVNTAEGVSTGSELQGEDFAKKMVDLVNQRKKYFAEERARAKRNKPMTQSQLKITYEYMIESRDMKYLS
ncbi:hypothetical protein Tco_0236448 [Tanacetum coccineum]